MIYEFYLLLKGGQQFINTQMIIFILKFRLVVIWLGTKSSKSFFAKCQWNVSLHNTLLFSRSPSSTCVVCCRALGSGNDTETRCFLYFMYCVVWCVQTLPLFWRIFYSQHCEWSFSLCHLLFLCCEWTSAPRSPLCHYYHIQECSRNSSWSCS